MPFIDDFSISFGRQGDAAAFQGDGWSEPEDGYTWTCGQRAEIAVPLRLACDYFLQLTHGVCRPDGRPWQRVVLSANGHPVVHYVARHAEDQEFWIPRSVIEGSAGPLRLVFDLPDAYRPADDGRADGRTLALAFKRLVLKAALPGLITRALLGMESIGRNCEFGLVQRQLGVEQISLLRWAGCETEDLIRALDARFAGLAEQMDGQPDPPDAPPERQHWWLTCRRYRILFHSDQTVAQTGVPEAAAKVRPRLRWLADKLLADIRTGEKVFVYSSSEFSGPADGLTLAAAFRRAGGNGPLLLVGQGDAGPPRMLAWNVWGASMPRLTGMGTANAADMAQWLRVIEQFAGQLQDAKLAAI